MLNLFHRKKEETKLFYHTDVHCHILQGVDHGSQNIAQSLDMLRAEMSMGITHVILTSHTTEGTFENTPETLKAAYDLLCQAVREAGLDIALDYSSEYRIDDYYMGLYEQGRIVPMPGNYILLENSFVQELIGIDELLFDLQCKGCHPILAHPERYRYYHRRHDRYEQLHSAGVAFQVNILSLAGYFGAATREAALWLVNNNLCDMLGSDMHSMEHARIIKDYLGKKEWRKLAEKLQGRVINDAVR